jgi:hypothetical protein
MFTWQAPNQCHHFAIVADLARNQPRRLTIDELNFIALQVFSPVSNPDPVDYSVQLGPRQALSVVAHQAFSRKAPDGSLVPPSYQPDDHTEQRQARKTDRGVRYPSAGQ